MFPPFDYLPGGPPIAGHFHERNMNHTITIGDVLIVSGIVLGLFVVGGGLILLLTIMNPFRSGH